MTKQKNSIKMVQTNAKLTVEALDSKSMKEGKIIETKQYYLMVETENGMTQINVGEKTYNTIKELTTPKEKVTTLQFEKPLNK